MVGFNIVENERLIVKPRASRSADNPLHLPGPGAVLSLHHTQKESVI